MLLVRKKVAASEERGGLYGLRIFSTYFLMSVFELGWRAICNVSILSLSPWSMTSERTRPFATKVIAAVCFGESFGSNFVIHGPYSLMYVLRSSVEHLVMLMSLPSYVPSFTQ